MKKPLSKRAALKLQQFEDSLELCRRMLREEMRPKAGSAAEMRRNAQLPITPDRYRPLIALVVRVQKAVREGRYQEAADYMALTNFSDAIWGGYFGHYLGWPSESLEIYLRHFERFVCCKKYSGGAK